MPQAQDEPAKLLCHKKQRERKKVDGELVAELG